MAAANTKATTKISFKLMSVRSMAGLITKHDSPNGGADRQKRGEDAGRRQGERVQDVAPGAPSIAANSMAAPLQ